MSPRSPALSSATGLLAAGIVLAGAGCGVGPDAVTMSPAAAVPAEAAPPDLAGHQFDPPHAAQVLVAGETAEITLPAGRLRLRVTGPALVPVATFGLRQPGQLRHWVATFTLAATALSGSVALTPDDVVLLDLAAPDGPLRVRASATEHLPTTLVAGQSVTATWSAPVVEGHGELLYAPAGVVPQALWDFRTEG